MGILILDTGFLIRNRATRIADQVAHLVEQDSWKRHHVVDDGVPAARTL